MMGWLTGKTVMALAKPLLAAYEIRKNAVNDKERIEADKHIAELQAQQSVLIAEQRNLLTRWIRPLFALPFIIYNFKIIVWDKVLGQGATDALPQEYWHLQMIVFGAYFLTRPLEKRK